VKIGKLIIFIFDDIYFFGWWVSGKWRFKI